MEHIFRKIIVWGSLLFVIIILSFTIYYWNSEDYRDLNPNNFFPENEAHFSKKKGKIADCPRCRYSYKDPIWASDEK